MAGNPYLSYLESPHYSYRDIVFQICWKYNPKSCFSDIFLSSYEFRSVCEYLSTLEIEKYNLR